MARNLSNRKYVEIALLTAGAIVLTLFTIPMPGFGFLKLDLSVVLIYLVFIRVGTKEGYFALFMTIIFNSLVKGVSAFGVGQIAYLIAFVIFYYTYTMLNKRYNKKLIPVIVTTLVMMVSMTLLNYFVITPAYILAFGGVMEDGSKFIYTEQITSMAYAMTILAVYPLFNLIQWGINITLIAALGREPKKEFLG